MLTDDETESLYNIIYSEKSVFRKYKKFKLPIFNKKKAFIKYYEKIKLHTLFLTGGNEEISFIL